MWRRRLTGSSVSRAVNPRMPDCFTMLKSWDFCTAGSTEVAGSALVAMATAAAGTPQH